MKYLLLLVLLGVFRFSTAQQLGHMSTWSSHQFAINPAHTGIKTCLEAQSTIRGQWIGFDGAPYTGWISVSSPLKAKRKNFLSARHGLGGLMYADKIGPFQQFSFLLNYAGHFNFSQTSRLSLGIAAGATQLSFDKEIANPLEPDPAINGSATQLAPDARFGAWFNTENYYFGLALYNLIPNKWDKIGRDAKSSFHGMFNAGTRVSIDQNHAILPALYLGFAPNSTIDLQVQAVADFNGRFSFGAGLRNTDALIFMLGYRFEEKWRLMYSYDFVLSALRPGTYHSHELTLAFSPCTRKIISTKGGSKCPLFE
jgi:type IX secretion system PorP/SprF family membrane protein